MMFRCRTRIPITDRANTSTRTTEFQFPDSVRRRSAKPLTRSKKYESGRQQKLAAFVFLAPASPAVPRASRPRVSGNEAFQTVRHSKRLLRIQQDRHRAFVHQFDPHHLLKAPSLAAQASGADLFDKILIELARHLRSSRAIERRPLPPTHIAIKSELRNDQHRSHNLGDRQIHLAAGILKNTQANDLLGKIIRVRARVTLAHAKQNQQPEPDLARNLAVHGNLGPAYALHYRPHQRLASPISDSCARMAC